jgi:hypothetical protein
MMAIAAVTAVTTTRVASPVANLEREVHEIYGGE